MGCIVPVDRGRGGVQVRIQVTSLDAVHLYVTEDGFGPATAMVALTPEEARAAARALNEVADSVDRVNTDPPDPPPGGEPPTGG
jgi:hypothetical protein